MTIQRAIEIVGGVAILGYPVGTGRELVAAMRDGLSVRTVEQLIASGRLSASEVDSVVLPRKTLSHRRKIGTLTPDQSDRLMRAARVIAAAEETFGSQTKAAAWLRRPTTALEGDTPLSLLDTSEGVLMVEDLLARIGHGLAA